ASVLADYYHGLLKRLLDKRSAFGRLWCKKYSELYLCCFTPITSQITHSLIHDGRGWMQNAARPRKLANRIRDTENKTRRPATKFCARSNYGVPTPSEAGSYGTFVMVVKSQWDY